MSCIVTSQSGKLIELIQGRQMIKT